MSALDGVVAGAAGTLALNAVTYADMAMRARPASRTPEKSVQKLAEMAHVGLGPEERAANRRAGLGPLLGYLTGTGVAVTFAALVRRPARVSPAALALGAAAMLAADAPLAALRISDPRRWSRADWLSDIVPHLAYGLVTAAVWRRLAGASRR